MAAERLFGALLVEMVSGHYLEGERFLSHRRIMRQWRVSAATANQALERLKAVDVVRVRDRSGHYLPSGFRERAMRALHSEDALASDPTPLQRHRLGMKVLLNRRTGCLVKSVAAVLVLRGDGHLRPDIRDSMLASCPASSLITRGILLEAENRRVIVNFFLCNGSPESQRRTLNRVLNSAPDGVILVKRRPHFQEKTLGKSLLEHGIPVVVLYGETGGSDMIAVNFNNVGIGVQAADLFLQKGHRNLAILTYREENSNFEDRLRGFYLGLTGKENVSVSEIRIENNNEPDEFRRVAAELRRKGVTALFSVAQELLANLVPALKEEGIEVPAGISVLMCSSTTELDRFPRRVDTLILEFTLLGQIAMRALGAYCSGQVAQKVHLVNPVVEACGSVTDWAGASVEPESTVH